MNIYINEELIGKRIKDIRTSKGLSQEELHKKTGIQNTVISAFEHGKRTPNLQSLAKIAHALGVTIDELYFGDESIAFIEKAPNKGAKIANCIYELMKENVITTIYRDERTKITNIDVNKYQYPIKCLIDNLKDFFQRYDTYSDPENFSNQIKESVATEINKIDKEDDLKEQQKQNILNAGL